MEKDSCPQLAVDKQLKWESRQSKWNNKYDRIKQHISSTVWRRVGYWTQAQLYKIIKPTLRKDNSEQEYVCSVFPSHGLFPV